LTFIFSLFFRNSRGLGQGLGLVGFFPTETAVAAGDAADLRQSHVGAV